VVFFRPRYLCTVSKTCGTACLLKVLKNFRRRVLALLLFFWKMVLQCCKSLDRKLYKGGIPYKIMTTTIELPAEKVRASGFSLPQKLVLEVPGGVDEEFDCSISIKEVDEIAKRNKVKNYALAKRPLGEEWDEEEAFYPDLHDNYMLELGFTYRIVPSNIAA
jgi:hypothetical protein